MILRCRFTVARRNKELPFIIFLSFSQPFERDLCILTTIIDIFYGSHFII